MTAVARHVAFDHLRLAKRRTWGHSGSIDALEGLDYVPEIVLVEPWDAKIDVEQLLGRLRPGCRTLFELAKEGHTLKEISRLTHLPMTTVKTRMHHARRKMKAVLLS